MKSETLWNVWIKLSAMHWNEQMSLDFKYDQIRHKCNVKHSLSMRIMVNAEKVL